MATITHCTFCRKKLEIGIGINMHQHGVRGHKRPIPLTEPELFCNERCLRDHLTDIPNGPYRIP